MQVIVIITDGRSDDTTLSVIQANLIKALGIKIIIIGVVPITDPGYTEIQQIASNPEEVIRLQVNNFAALSGKLTPLKQAMCVPPLPSGESTTAFAKWSWLLSISGESVTTWSQWSSLLCIPG